MSKNLALIVFDFILLYLVKVNTSEYVGPSELYTFICDLYIVICCVSNFISRELMN